MPTPTHIMTVTDRLLAILALTATIMKKRIWWNGAKKAKKPTRPNIFLFSVVIRHYFQDNMMNKENM